MTCWSPKLRTIARFACNTDAVPFYAACEFTPIDEFVEFVEVRPVASESGAVKLDPGNKEHRDRIYKYAERRGPVSKKFSVLNPKLFAFHCLHSLKDRVYEIPDLKCLVCYERADGRLKIFDIVSEEPPAFEQFYPYIAADGDREVEFHFHADKLGLEKLQARQLSGNNPFVKGTFPIERPVFPYTCRA